MRPLGVHHFYVFLSLFFSETRSSTVFASFPRHFAAVRLGTLIFTFIVFWCARLRVSSSTYTKWSSRAKYIDHIKRIGPASVDFEVMYSRWKCGRRIMVVQLGERIRKRPNPCP